MDIHGRDIETESYRVSAVIDGTKVIGLVPERFAADPRFGARPSHETFYQWLASHADTIETALATLARGGRPKAPFNEITLIEER